MKTCSCYWSDYDLFAANRFSRRTLAKRQTTLRIFSKYCGACHGLTLQGGMVLRY